MHISGLSHLRVLLILLTLALFLSIFLFSVLHIKDIEPINRMILKITQSPSLKLNINQRILYNQKILNHNIEFMANHLTKQEIAHMNEVYAKISFFNIIQIVLSILTIIDFIIVLKMVKHNKKFKPDIKRLFVRDILVIVIVIIGLVLLSFLLFPYIFVLFHKCLFRTQWQFPASSVLINIYPFSYFVIYFAVSTITALIIFVILLFLMYKCLQSAYRLRKAEKKK